MYAPLDGAVLFLEVPLLVTDMQSRAMGLGCVKMQNVVHKAAAIPERHKSESSAAAIFAMIPHDSCIYESRADAEGLLQIEVVHFTRKVHDNNVNAKPPGLLVCNCPAHPQLLQASVPTSAEGSKAKHLAQ